MKYWCAHGSVTFLTTKSIGICNNWLSENNGDHSIIYAHTMSFCLLYCLVCFCINDFIYNIFKAKDIATFFFLLYAGHKNEKRIFKAFFHIIWYIVYTLYSMNMDTDYLISSSVYFIQYSIQSYFIIILFIWDCFILYKHFLHFQFDWSHKQWL